MAQETGDDFVIEEIVVTAQKREQNAQEVPISLYALDGRNLRQSGVDSVEKLGELAAGVEIVGQGTGAVQMNMRGVTNLAYGQLDSTAAIGYYVDETPISSFFPDALPDVALWDVDRVEILRGPQGTLFGESSMGGTIRIMSRRPDPTSFGGWITANVDSVSDGGNGYGASLSLNVPIVDDELALRLNVSSRVASGWIDVPDLGLEDANDLERSGVNLALAWSPNNLLDLQLSYMDQQTDIDTWSFATSPGIYDPRSLAPPGVIAPVGQLSPTDNRFKLTNLTVNSDIGRANLVSATTYFENEASSLASLDEGSIVFFGELANITETFNLPIRSLTQELRLASTNDAMLNWTVGAFFKRNERGGFFQFAFDIPAFMLVDVARQHFDVEINSYALFGEVDYLLTDRWALKVGGRYYSDNRNVAKEQTTTSVILGTVDGMRFSEDDSDDDFAPSFGVSWTGDGHLFYSRVAKGFRAGGINDNMSFAPGEIDSGYLPEELWTYELGTKNLLWQDRLQLNAYLYLNRWKSIQLTQTTSDGLFLYTTNAGAAEALGTEIELTVQPTANFALTANVSYIDSEISDNAFDGQGNVIIPAGNKIPFTPDTTLQLSAEYSWPMFSNLYGTIHGRYAYRAENLSDAVNTPELKNDKYQQVFLRLGLKAKNWVVHVSAINLLDNADTVLKDYMTGPIPIVLLSNYVQPRTYRLELRWEF